MNPRASHSSASSKSAVVSGAKGRWFESTRAYHSPITYKQPPKNRGAVGEQFSAGVKALRLGVECLCGMLFARVTEPATPRTWYGELWDGLSFFGNRRPASAPTPAGNTGRVPSAACSGFCWDIPTHARSVHAGVSCPCLAAGHQEKGARER